MVIENHQMEKMDRGSVNRLAAPLKTTPSFAIPLVQFNNFSNALYVQRVNQRGEVINFDLFQDSCPVIELDQSVDVALGKREVLACVDPWGQPLVGTQTMLAPQIKKWVAQVDSPLQRLSFASVCNAQKVLEEAAIATFDRKVRELRNRNDAVLWFVRSIALLDLVKSLGRHLDATKQPSHRNIFEDLNVDVFIEQKRLVILLPHLLMQKQTTEKRRYGKALTRALSLIELVTHFNIDLKEQPRPEKREIGTDERYQEFIANIASLPRQEERLSALIEAIVKEPDLGRRAIGSYSDRANFANNAISLLRESIDLNEGTQITEYRIAQTLKRFLSKSYPKQRERFLLHLLDTLGNRSAIPGLLRSKK